MKVILKEDVKNLGNIGDIVEVKRGYARNFLLPRSLAIVSNQSNKALFEYNLGLIKEKQKLRLEQAQILATKISKLSITVSKVVGENDKIFGSVTPSELEHLLRAENVNVSKKDIKILDDIKKVGVYTAEVKVHRDVFAKFKIWVVSS